MRACIIGLGAVSGNHIDGLKRAGAEIAGLCDIIFQKAEKRKQEFGLNCKVFTDYKEMLNAVKPDSVHICTPHYLHAEMIVYALNLGINVLCEKPVCISKQEFELIEKAERLSTAKLGICFQNRFLPCNIELKKRLEGRKVLGVNGILLWHRGKDYYTADDWHGKLGKEGGGVIINQAIHTLDLMVTNTLPPKTVEAQLENNSLKGIIEVEDTADCILRNEMFNMRLYATNAAADNFSTEVQYITDKGVLSVRDNALFDNGTEVIIPEKVSYVGKAYWGYGHSLLIEDFYCCLNGGKEFCVNLKSTKNTMLTVFAIYSSGGKIITI